MNLPWERISGSLLGVVAGGGEGPWRAKTVLLALLIIIVGLGLWLRDVARNPAAESQTDAAKPPASPAVDGGWQFSRPVPGYVRVCASYIGGFCIGWVFRRFIRVALALAAVALLLVGLGKYAGCNTAPAETKVKAGVTWVEKEADSARNYLQGLLPSISAGAVGAFFGWRRKGRTSVPNAAPPAS